MRYSDLLERKQVGILYHFTDMQTAWIILANMELKAKEGGGLGLQQGMFVIDRFRDWVSLTRNYQLAKTAAAGGNGDPWGDCRIAIDGDRLSDRNHIEPYHDADDYLSRHDNQAEERIRRRQVSLKGCVVRVNVLVDLAIRNATNYDDWITQPDEQQQAKYDRMIRNDIDAFLEYCNKLGITAKAVTAYRPVDRAR